MGERGAPARTRDGVLLRLNLFLIAWLLLILLWSLAFMVVEGFSFIDSLYFSIVTVTTVGYGDLSAQTALGRIMAILLILTGVGTFGGLLASVTEVLLNRRERRARLARQNMVIGVFFSEVGTRLLAYFSDFDSRLEEIRQDLLVTGDWTPEQFDRVSKRIRRHHFDVDARRLDFEHLHAFLSGKRGFLLRLLENPSLMAHERFTDLLLAVFHLAEELGHRRQFQELPAADQAHLAGDVQRIYVLLVHEWLEYMRYLQTGYPYLFSLAIRTNPFDEQASPVVSK